MPCVHRVSPLRNLLKNMGVCVVGNVSKPDKSLDQSREF